MLGFKVPYDISERTKDCLLDCVECLLPSGSGSRMYKEIRDKRGLAYAVGGDFNTEFALSRYFYAYVETSKEHVAEVDRLLANAMAEPFTDKHDFEEARERTIDRATIGFDDSSDTYAELIWENISENRPIKNIATHFSRTRRTLQSITLEEIEDTRKKFFCPERFVTVIVEPG